MKKLFGIVFILFILFSCSKEENIPFEDSIKDTINPVFYEDISGIYDGIIYDILFLSENRYIRLDSELHSVEVSEIDFNNVLIKGISNRIESDAQADMFRVNRSGGYLSFLPGTMADSTGIDSVYQNRFNGIYFYGPQSLEYFFFFVQGEDTTHQTFRGNRP